MMDLRLALLQCESHPGDVPANLRRLDRECRQAAAQGANLLVTPEMFLTGYNVGGATVAALAEGPYGARLQAVVSIARRHGIAVVFGHPERDHTGAIFNAAVCVDDHGRILGTYRKTHLFGELDAIMFSAGSGEQPLFHLHGWKVAMLICYDVEFPETTRQLALKGADLVVVPTANFEGFDFVAHYLVPTRAYENQLFVAYANFCGREGDAAYNGLSCIAAPDGTLLAQGGRDPCLLLADVTRDALAAGRRLNGHMSICRASRE